MVGGVVIDVAHQCARVRLWCAERLYDEAGNRAGIGYECGVYIEPGPDLPEVGDDVWWHGGKVYWTPSDRRFTDRPLRKIGYSSSGPEMLSDA